MVLSKISREFKKKKKKTGRRRKRRKKVNRRRGICMGDSKGES